MNRMGPALGLAAAILVAYPFAAGSSGSFDQKLPADKQILHALNRLTFGPRAGDVAAVRRIGLDKWIDLQLHPERLAEPSVVDDRLKPLTTLQLETWQILERYPPAPLANIRPPSLLAFQSLSPLDRAKLTSGSADERRATLLAFDPEQRQLVLAGLPPPFVDGLPDDLKDEANRARTAEQQRMAQERMRMMPPLPDLLSPEQIRTARTGSSADKVALIDSLPADRRPQVLRALGPQTFLDVPSLRREAMAASQPQQYVHDELIANRLYRAIYSNRQLQEILVDFWLNHFNVFNGKGQGRALLTSFERDAIRPHVLGHFRDLLLATARHPAMLFYLDNWQSQVQRDDLPVPPLPPGVQRPGLNENYGRELLELHTLGVDGGYTQQDVVAVARAFSGWTIYDFGKYCEFQFNPNGHDRKEKLILGETLPAGRGEQDGLDVIDLLARHPSTAKFISKELAERFVADDPPASLIARMADTFARTDGDLRAVLETMFTSTEFMSEGAWQAKLKSPLEMVVSAVRAAGADIDDTYALSQRIADLGEPLYGKVDPAGYANTGDAWASTAGILGRINFAAALTAGQIPGVKVNLSRWNFQAPAAVAADILGAPPSQTTLAAIEKGMADKEASPSVLAALIMGSPDFQRR